MSTTYTWSVVQMTCYPELEGETDVVFRVRWMCQASSDATPVPTVAVADGATDVTLTPGSPFTPYSQLTPDQVLGWVWANGVNKDDIEAQLQARIDLQVSPPVVNPPLPWA